MKESTAKKKYKKHWKAMQEHLTGITCTIAKDGELIIPERDLRYAYDMAVKGRSELGWD